MQYPVSHQIMQQVPAMVKAKKALSQLKVKLEDKYLCRENFLIDVFLIKEQHRSGEYIKSQYYYTVAGLRRGIITTKNMRDVCYDMNDLIKGNDIERTGLYTGGRAIYWR